MVTERMVPLTVDGRRVHQVGLPYHWGGNGLVQGDSANDLLPLVLDSNVHISEFKSATCDVRPGRRPRGPALLEFVERLPAPRGGRTVSAELEVRTYGPEARERVGFFTDTSICIGCKACEVACKEWNGVPDDGFEQTGYSMDNTKGLGADTWRHVAFIEQREPPDVTRGACPTRLPSTRRGESSGRTSARCGG